MIPSAVGGMLGPCTRGVGRVIALVAPMLVARVLGAQERQCLPIVMFGGGSIVPICYTAVDAAMVFQPLWGMNVSGGDPRLGTAGALGRLGRASVTVRVNALPGSLPDPANASAFSVPSSSVVFSATEVAGAVGLWQGVRPGLLSLDALGSVVFIARGSMSDLWRSPQDSRVLGSLLGSGYGARIGLHHGAVPFPSLSLSYMRRSLPRIQYGSPPPVCCSGDQFEFDLDLRADNYRLTAGWQFPVIDLVAGIGIDHYHSSVHIHGVGGTSLGIGSFDLAMFGLSATRQVVFADAGLRLAGAKVVGELGYQPGQDDHLTTQFSGFDPKAGHAFGSLGLRFDL